MSDLARFLLARIAEDEDAQNRQYFGETCDLDYDVHWSTQRVLAECAAKRTIVEEFVARHNDADLMLGPPILRQREWAGLWLAVKIIAGPYATHPDYRAEWVA